MKKLLFLAAAVAVFSFAAFGQKADYSGTWTLDVGKSKLDERARIESMTLTVAQTDKELKVETVTKRLAPPADAPQGGGRGMGRGGFGGGDGTVTYSLDGKEIKAEIDGPMGKMPVTYTAKSETDGKLKLSSSRTINSPMGEALVTTKETWSLSSDGKALTVEREMSTPRGTNQSTMVFAKK